MIGAEASSRLSMLRFPLVVAVVFIHAEEAAVHMAGRTIGPAAPDFIERFIRLLVSDSLARVAVPLFFFISGYLFFQGPAWSSRIYRHKLRSRVRTLLIPFLLWSTWTVCVFALAQRIPGLHDWFSGTRPRLDDLSGFELLDAWLGLTHYPMAYHLWFIRDLMVLALLSPLIRWFVGSVLARPYLAVLAACWCIDMWPVGSPAIEGLLFFSIGAWRGVHGASPFPRSRLGVACLLAFLPLGVIDALWMGACGVPQVHKAVEAIGVLGVLHATSLAPRGGLLQRRLAALSAASFFVYAGHEPLLMMTRKLLYGGFEPQGSAMGLLLYALGPLIVIFVLLAVRLCLKASWPSLLRVATGGRS